MFKERLFYIALTCLSLLTSCKKEIATINEPIKEPVVADCSTIETYISKIETNHFAEKTIESIDSTVAQYFAIKYLDGDSIAVCKSVIENILYNNDYSLVFEFTDGKTTTTSYWEEGFTVDAVVELNPSGYAPLSAKLKIKSKIKCSIFLKVSGKNGQYSDVVKTFNEISMEHELPILGLYPDYKNTVSISTFIEDKILGRQVVEIQTGKSNPQLPLIKIDVNKVQQMASGFQLVSFLDAEPSLPFMMDAFGDIRWYLDFSEHPDLIGMFYDVGIERLQNGNFYFGDVNSANIYEVDVYGNVIESWQLPEHDFHHNVLEKPDGNFLATCHVGNSMHLLGGFSYQDRIMELDRNSGTINKLWDMRYFLDETRETHRKFAENDYKNWAHLNAVFYDESDNSILFSSRSQCAFGKIDYQDSIHWLIAPHIGWGVNRNGDSIKNFLLTAVDVNGVPYNEAVQMGNEATEDFDWAWAQHAIKKIGDNRYMVFDNGNGRQFGGKCCYSRAVIYKVDPYKRTVQQIWQYGKERGSETFSRCCSDVDFLPEQNHIIFSPGLEVDNGDGIGGKIIEIDYHTKEILFEARLYSDFITLHRSERLNIYPD